MVEKLFVTQEKTATITCPNCHFSKTIDASNYIQLEKQVRIKVVCPCGHTIRLLLERRKNYRKVTNLLGKYVHSGGDNSEAEGQVKIVDLSATGVKFELHKNHGLSEGDVLEIHFRLDDLKKTPIRKKVVVRNISDPFIGADFIKTEYEDKDLGFYLR